MSVNGRITGKVGSWMYGETPTKISGLTDWSLSAAASEIDATAMEDVDEVTLDGIPKRTGTCNLRYESDSEEQRDAAQIGQQFPVKLYADETHYISGVMRITGRDDGAKHNETVNVAIKFSLHQADYSNYYDVVAGS